MRERLKPGTSYLVCVVAYQYNTGAGDNGVYEVRLEYDTLDEALDARREITEAFHEDEGRYWLHCEGYNPGFLDNANIRIFQVTRKLI